MATLADSLVSSASRPLALRARPDLVARKHFYQGRPWWVVKDPLALQYFRFQEEEYAILRWLDGRVSLAEVKTLFERRFPPQRITVEELQSFIGSLYRSGLVVAQAAGQGPELKRRRDERKRKELLAAVGNILCIRFKGFDPDRLLDALYPFVRWAFAPWTVIATLAFGLSALALVAVQFETFQAKLPSFHQFFTPQNALWMAVALAATKVLHEFGHAFSCKHFGGECHEMGVMVLVLTPCLYCNVSDSWLLPNKWQRAAIGAGGMYVELAIAAAATYVWWFSAPGLLNQLALSTMFVCSVSTILFNGNPLMRYDGYYILSDIVEIPNLRQKSDQVLQRKLGEWCLGLELPHDPFLPQRNQWLFALYTVSAAVYRWVVVFSILWFLHKFFEPYRLEVLGQILGILSLYSLLVLPLWKLGKFLWTPGRVDQVKRKNVAVSLAVVAAIAAAVLLIPLPHYVVCTLEVQPRDAAAVYVDVPGTLVALHVRPGDAVEAGAELATLEDVDADISIARLTGERDKQATQLRALKKNQFRDTTAKAQIPQTEETLAAIEAQLEKLLADRARLVLKAPIAGTVLPPAEVAPKPSAAGRLPTWSGTPLQERNLGCYLTAGVPFCHVGDRRRWQANLVIDQGDIEFIREGQSVAIKLDELPHDTLVGEIAAIAHSDLEVSPRQLSNKSGGELATETDELGREKPQSASYQARVPLDDDAELLHLGLRGTAKIRTPSRTLAQRLGRYLAQTFHFRL